MDKMQIYWILKQVVHVVTIVLYEITYTVSCLKRCWSYGLLRRGVWLKFAYFWEVFAASVFRLNRENLKSYFV